MTTTIIAGIFGFILGAAIAWAMAVSRRGATASGDGGAAVLERELVSAKDENRRLNSALSLAQSTTAAAEEGKRNAEENLKSQLAQLENAETKLKDAFAKAASDALSINNKHFMDLAETKFKSLQQHAAGDLEA